MVRVTEITCIYAYRSNQLNQTLCSFSYLHTVCTFGDAYLFHWMICMIYWQAGQCRSYGTCNCCRSIHIVRFLWTSTVSSLHFENIVTFILKNISIFILHFNLRNGKYKLFFPFGESAYRKHSNVKHYLLR